MSESDVPLEVEAEALVELFNDAAPDHAPDLSWWAMNTDHETKTQRFVLDAHDYIDPDGLAALREHGWTIEYIEANQMEGDIIVSISVPVRGEMPDRTDTNCSNMEVTHD